MVGQEAGYHTNEYSSEVLVPLIGGDFSFPLVKAVELNAAYRFVDNSIAGGEDVWGSHAVLLVGWCGASSGVPGWAVVGHGEGSPG